MSPKNLVFFALICLFSTSNSYAQLPFSQNFNGAGTPAGWTTINNSVGGFPAEAAWTLRPDGYTYSSIFVDPTEFHSNDNTQFYLSNSDAQDDPINGFTETILQSPPISTVGETVVTLIFYNYFWPFTAVDAGYIEVSTDGNNWTAEKTITDITEVGSVLFKPIYVNLNAYSNLPAVHIRFRYYAEFGFFWAIDNFLLTNTPNLPVDLLSFSGYKNGNYNVLKWTTATEQNNRGFRVERSVDGINFNSIAFVNSLAAAGYSINQLNYLFTDDKITGDKQFYRLRQTDIDGREKLSQVIIIRAKKSESFHITKLFPNPASHEIQVLIDAPQSEDIIIQVIGINGELLVQKKSNVGTGINNIPVQIANLTKGNYILKVIFSSSGISDSKKFLKL